MWEESAEMAEQALKEFGVKYEKAKGKRLLRTKDRCADQKCFRQRRHYRHGAGRVLFGEKF